MSGGGYYSTATYNPQECEHHYGDMRERAAILTSCPERHSSACCTLRSASESRGSNLNAVQSTFPSPQARQKTDQRPKESLEAQGLAESKGSMHVRDVLCWCCWAALNKEVVSMMARVAGDLCVVGR